MMKKELEMTIAKQLGGIKIIIGKDLREAEFIDMGGIGKIFWSMGKPSHIEPYNRELRNKITEKAKELGVKHDALCRLGFTDEQKNILNQELKNKTEDLFKRLVGDKVKFVLEQCDWPMSIKTDKETKFLLDMAGYNLAIYLEMRDIPVEKRFEGADVTKYVIDKIKEIKKDRERHEEYRQEMEREKKKMKVKIIKKGKVDGGDGPDYYAKVELTDLETGEKAVFHCRNIFDFGYVINPVYAIAEGLEPGGLSWEENNKMYWQTFSSGKGWYNVRELTAFEQKAIKYLNMFPPIAQGINM